jgi:hypothetical protein
MGAAFIFSRVSRVIFFGVSITTHVTTSLQVGVVRPPAYV